MLMTRSSKDHRDGLQVIARVADGGNGSTLAARHGVKSRASRSLPLPNPAADSHLAKDSVKIDPPVQSGDSDPAATPDSVSRPGEEVRPQRAFAGPPSLGPASAARALFADAVRKQSDIRSDSRMLQQRKPGYARYAVVLASGLVLGAVVAGWAALQLQAPATPDRTVQSVPAGSTVAKAHAAAARLHACPAAPVIAASSRDDGRLQPRNESAAVRSASDIPALILSGKEAAAAGRLRDAEVSFLLACRAADQLQRADATEPAEARYQLARHYAQFMTVADVPAGAARTELRNRAELLYSDSVHSYQARYGESHEKTRFAVEGLATLRQSFAQASAVAAPVTTQAPVAHRAPQTVVAVQPPAPAARNAVFPTVVPSQPAIVTVAPPPRVSKTQVVNTPLRPATGAPTLATPSFNCSLARSPAERRICSDSELAQLDRDLGRLHARAKSATADAAGFRRRNDREWRWRETNCGGERECLLQWYGNRRDQLLAELAVNR